VIRLMGLPSVARAPEVRLERSADSVVLWFLGADDERPVQRVVVPGYALADGEDPETVDLRVLAQLRRLGYDARGVAPGPTPPPP
jgi:hypothetical protein